MAQGTVRYTHHPFLVAALARDALLGRKRSFREDAAAFVRHLNPPLRILGKENIPQQAPCIVMANHYFRPGFQAWWIALGIAACIPLEMYWVMTGELTFPGKWYAWFGSALSRFILARIARTYSFTTMPPMPPRPKDVAARARAVREVVECVRERRPILGITPEGGDQPGGRLTMPASGSGRFALLISNPHIPIVPVGVYESEEDFCLRFGEAFCLSVAADLPSDEKDTLAAQMMMRKIAALLPENLRGEFA